MAPRRAVITGLGAVSGFGRGAELLFTARREGRRAMRRIEALAAAGLPSLVALEPGGDPLAPGERAVAMALWAAAEAVADAGGVEAGEALGVSVGTTLGGIGGFLDTVRGQPDPGTVESPIAYGRGGWSWAAPASAIAAAHGARGPVRVESVACSSGNAALGAALDDVRSGRATQVIAGGVDTLTDFVIAGFGVLKAIDPQPCRPFDGHRAGLNLGEGACFLIVEEEQHARARGARIRAVLAGYGDASDAHHMTGPDPEGRGAARAMAVALADAGLAPSLVDYVSAHGTSTHFNDLMEHHALHALLGVRAARIPVNSIKGAVGHTLGAAGALEALVCVRQLEEQLIVPTAGHVLLDPEIELDVVAGAARPAALRVALSTSSGFGGTNAAVVLTTVT